MYGTCLVKRFNKTPDVHEQIGRKAKGLLAYHRFLVVGDERKKENFEQEKK